MKLQDYSGPQKGATHTMGNFFWEKYQISFLNFLKIAHTHTHTHTHTHKGK